jgi:hypothetical protein
VAAHVGGWPPVLVAAAGPGVHYGVVVAVGRHRSGGVHRGTARSVALGVLRGPV